MSLTQCDRCGGYRSVRWVDTRTGELTADFENGAQLCLDCQADVTPDGEESIAADD